MAWIVNILVREDRQKMVLLRRHIRDYIDPFDIAENRFIELYRFPQYLVIELIEEIREFYDDQEEHPFKIPLALKVLAALNFYAHGSYQRMVGQDALQFMSQSMVSRSINLISNILSTHLLNQYVKFPENQEEINKSKERFFINTGYPHAIGIIDGTHMKLTAISKEVEMGYVCRKGFHSINVQIICDYDMRIININARYPGSTHDSYIWANSKVNIFLRRIHNENTYNFLLGDEGYGLQPWLIIPFRNPVTAREKNFNQIHCQIRGRVELSIGKFKNKFRCLIENELRYTPLKVAKIINSCAVLYNKLHENGLIEEEEEEGAGLLGFEVQQDDDEDGDDMNNADHFPQRNQITAAGREAREFIVNFLFPN